VFRPAGRRLAAGDPWLTAADATEFDQELLTAWWRPAAESDPRVVDPVGADNLIHVTRPGNIR
jgi:hypothetical protein